LTNAAFTREVASRALREARIVGPPVDLDDVALSRALRIERNAVLGPGVRAAYDAVHGLIRVASLPPPYERFPLAHEIGHALLDEGGATCTVEMIETSEEAVSLAEALAEFNPETTASSIGSYLLVPPRWLREEVRKGRQPTELAEIFEVSSNVIWIALDRSHLVNKLAPGRG
jgi:hypothetical protein